ncbi:AGE family epimerase/isomerase [Paracoccus sp. JM45]|uniref:AGE family epimerase/isomerase n=1 Tax=Paracoccus sp. JM45 TaxID=2283626 RepID=UPI000E6D1EFE|nr:AGE family epimerase/isomerase [Paracoccus sp. JM45]RJE78903.1 sugar isomerase [Paracoccus sp. JM45]
MDDLHAASRASAAWADRRDHREWLRTEGRRLLRHYARARVPRGFATLGNDGLLVDKVPQGIVTARKVHCYSLATLMGIPGASALAGHGIAALLDGPLRDHAAGGWFEDASGPSRKKAYLHAFMALAGASATMAGLPRGQELMQAATDIIDRHFWIASEKVMQPSFAADWSDPEAYRGANCNMHTTEACLALSDATGDPRWLDRAIALARRFGHDIPAAHDGLLPEHFAPDWTLLPDYGADQPADDTRPYGLTPGHHAEWAGLLLKVEAACEKAGRPAMDWPLTDAVALFDRSVELGWAPDGQPGMVYTVGFDGTVSVSMRAYWVQAELANTALMLYRRTNEPRFEAIYRKAWDFIADRLIDYDAGGWRHEVNASGHLSGIVYPTREDLYHDFQATVTPLIPTSASLAGGLR